MTQAVPRMLPALRPDPHPQHTVQAHCRHCIWVLRGHSPSSTRPSISKPQAGCQRELPGGAPGVVVHRSCPWPRPLCSHCAFQLLGLTWAACHSTSGIFGGVSVGTHVQPRGSTEDSALSASTCHLFPTFFLVPCFINVILGFIALYLLFSSLLIFLMSVVCFPCYLSTLISYMFL